MWERLPGAIPVVSHSRGQRTMAGVTNIYLLSAFVNKVALTHSCTYSFIYCLSVAPFVLSR